MLREREPDISFRKDTPSTVKKIIARCFLSIKAERKKRTSEEMRDSKKVSQKADGSLLFLLKTAKRSALVGHRGISYPTGVVSEAEPSS